MPAQKASSGTNRSRRAGSTNRESRTPKNTNAAPQSEREQNDDRKDEKNDKREPRIHHLSVSQRHKDEKMSSRKRSTPKDNIIKGKRRLNSNRKRWRMEWGGIRQFRRRATQQRKARTQRSEGERETECDKSKMNARKTGVPKDERSVVCI
ncbi:hypothetical protein C8R45DRAFT_193857 [Mycena sanguinolenta]|nr:hypothetical protein C8R45DRAFT_193857 [Mycena sanguinolenta]